MLLHTMRRLLAAHTTLPASAPGLPLPRGKGMFLGEASLRQLGGPEAMARRVRQAGLRWVAPLVVFQRSGQDDVYNTSSGAAECIAAIREAGAAIYPWCYPIPKRWQRAVEMTRQKVRDWLCDGMLLDPEVEWYGQAREMDRMMDAALEVHGEGRSLGVSSYGAPWFHQRMPWRELARADFGVPQCYDSHGKLGDDYPAKSVAAYRAAGFRCVIPAFPTYGARSPSRSDLERYLRCFPAARGYIGWQWRLTDDGEWVAIAAWQPPMLEASA